MNRKAAIGLSVNTMVIIIISLVILGLGISFLFKFVGISEDTAVSFGQRTDDELNRLLLDEGKQVALPQSSRIVHGNDEVIFGIGILNINDPNKFNIEISQSSVPDGVGNLVMTEWFLWDSNSFTIKGNEHKKQSIMATIPATAAKGKYIFNVEVIRETPPDDGIPRYGPIQKIYLEVK